MKEKIKKEEKLRLKEEKKREKEKAKEEMKDTDIKGKKTFGNKIKNFFKSDQKKSNKNNTILENEKKE